MRKLRLKSLILKATGMLGGAWSPAQACRTSGLTFSGRAQADFTLLLDARAAQAEGQGKASTWGRGQSRGFFREYSLSNKKQCFDNLICHFNMATSKCSALFC